jgi:hypothetical protein
MRDDPQGDYVSYADHAVEVARLTAEIEVLKGRKVVLPQAVWKVHMLVGPIPDPTGTWYRHDDVVSAIRAAGIGVEENV